MCSNWGVVTDTSFGEKAWVGLLALTHLIWWTVDELLGVQYLLLGPRALFPGIQPTEDFQS